MKTEGLKNAVEEHVSPKIRVKGKSAEGGMGMRRMFWGLVSVSQVLTTLMGC